ncbi:EamA family transporter [Rhodococcus rhodnii]|uniref:Amino acid ABC transporter n=2 Tax=Rhodococcus rhodnii TaxID=38312 RepID=R7WIW1_9NOCA|nr:EamA family transporter [Rhodococcus rhodnii]EOM75143.1 amino acid ABC transporter [Rhodococcus rhodnii LMG 5362]TXG89379.1 EamA family transporter [Rhodococcus rhodnii]
MTLRDRTLALTVVVLWGLNFIALRSGLDHFPPFFFAALRFAVIAVPVVLLVRPPKVPVRWLLGYGLGFGVGQFAFLFWAMDSGMPTGLASVVLQSSAPFTVVLGALLLREHLHPVQVAGLVVAVAGMTVIGWDRAQHAALIPVLLTLLAGLSWAFGNLSNRLAATDEPMRLMLWMCVVPPLPMFALSFAVEGPTAGWDALAESPGAWRALAGLAYTALLATIVGSGLWTALMSRYPASSVAPFSLLVPIVGIAASWLLLHETPSVWSLLGAAIVIAGATAATPRVRRDVTPAHLDLPAPAAAAMQVGDRVGTVPDSGRGNSH